MKSRFSRPLVAQILGDPAERETQLPAYFLVAIAIQRNCDPGGFDPVDYLRPTKVTLLLVGLARGQMARAGMAMLDFAIGGQTETLLGRLVGFLLGDGLSVNLLKCLAVEIGTNPKRQRGR